MTLGIAEHVAAALGIAPDEVKQQADGGFPTVEASGDGGGDGDGDGSTGASTTAGVLFPWEQPLPPEANGGGGGGGGDGGPGPAVERARRVGGGATTRGAPSFSEEE